jgi:hypothetical protein
MVHLLALRGAGLYGVTSRDFAALTIVDRALACEFPLDIAAKHRNLVHQLTPRFFRCSS